MIVFPAIDLKGGDVVRLAEGDMDRATVYGDDPSAQARLFADAGQKEAGEGGNVARAFAQRRQQNLCVRENVE